MSCDWREEQAYSFAGGSLDVRGSRDFESHLEGCPRCRSLVSEAREVDGLLRATLVPMPAPVSLESRVAGAIALEREQRRRPRWSLSIGRLSLSPVAALALVIALLAATYLMAPGAVIAVVQRALIFVPGLGIRPVDQGHLVAPNPVAVQVGGMTFRVEALLSDGEGTTLSFSVTGLPGGKGKEEKAVQAGKEQPAPSAKGAPPAPRLRDDAGREYSMTTGHYGIGGTPAENTIQGQMSFPPLAGGLESVELVVPSGWLAPDILGPALAPEGWTVRIPLAAASSSGLPEASPRGAGASARGVTLRVAALTAGSGSTVVLLEGQAGPDATITAIGKNGGDVSQAATLRDNLGRSYPLTPQGSRSTRTDEPYREDLYFPALAPLARQLTLTIQSVRLAIEGSATVTLPVENLRPGEKLPLNRAVDLGGYRLTLESARLEGDWLYVDVDPGPAVDGRALSSFSVDGQGSFMVSMGSTNGEQVSHFGVQLQPGQREVKLQISRPLVNVEGPWQITFPAQPSP